MAITGGMKFLKKSFAHIDVDGVSISMTSGSQTRNNMRTPGAAVSARSSGSNDSTVETWVVTFADAVTIDRLLLRGHNFKAFTAEYWDGALWQPFAGVVTKAGSQAALSETACTATSSYYEFTAVTTEKVRLTISTTQTANAEKELRELIVTAELGTLTGYPAHRPSFVCKQLAKESASGRVKYTIMGERYAASIEFSNYVRAEDHALMLALWEAKQEFLIYPCGGNDAQFRFPMKGNRLEDIFLVWFEGDFAPSYTAGVYVLGLSYQLQLVEVI